jgi:hypothetical protein
MSRVMSRLLLPGQHRARHDVRHDVDDACHMVSGMTTWEYATVPLMIHATKQILDNWGADGWELVQVIPGPDGSSLVAYFKREKN